jgi:hypothetical protein
VSWAFTGNAFFLPNKIAAWFRLVCPWDEEPDHGALGSFQRLRVSR